MLNIAVAVAVVLGMPQFHTDGNLFRRPRPGSLPLLLIPFRLTVTIMFLPQPLLEWTKGTRTSRRRVVSRRRRRCSTLVVVTSTAAAAADAAATTVVVVAGTVHGGRYAVLVVIANAGPNEKWWWWCDGCGNAFVCCFFASSFMG